MEKFLDFSALQLASDKLKQHYIEEMIEWVIDQPFNFKSSGGTNPLSREQDYVDLAVLTGEQVDNEWKNSDRQSIMQMNHLRIQSIGINDLWKANDQFVVVRGVAGIGKSTLIKRYVLKWARDEILNGENDDQKIDFLFFFECRELNTIQSKKSFEELLKVKYPEIFDFVDLSDLQKIAGRIMIIVDGLDELQGVYDESREEKYPMTKIVKEMIDPKSSILKGHKTIVGGRHNACESIMSKLTHTPIKIVEVCGFNIKKSVEYIKHFFGSDVERADKVKEIIKRPKIGIMANVPVLLWIICLLYSEDFEKEINTVTELYVYGLLAFLHNHIRGHENSVNIGLASFVTSQRFGEIIYSLSTLSVMTYMKGEVVFTDNDIRAIGCDFNLEETGLMVKHSIGNFGHQVYQFKHLIFQEFLCSLHLCLAKGVSKYNTNRELSSCTSTILGIHHLVESQHSQLFLDFYQNLETVHKNSRTYMEYFMVPLRKFTYNKFIQQKKRMIQQHQQTIQKYCEKNKFNITDRDFKLFDILRNFRENDWLIDENTAKKIQNSEISVGSSLNKSMEVLEFLRSLSITRINKFWLITLKITEADLDLIEMADKNSSTLSIGFIEGPYSEFYSGTTSLYVSIEKKQVVPDYFKSSFKSFRVNSFNPIEVTFRNIESLNNMFFMVSDLIEHVLENYGNKKLTIYKNNPFGKKNLLNEQFVQKIQNLFGQREHFENIEIFDY